MVVLALLNLVYPGLGLFLRREALQGMLYFLATTLVITASLSIDPQGWWIGYVWGAAQVHFFRVRHLEEVRPFGRVGTAIVWVMAGLCLLSTLRDGSAPCPPCALTGRPLLYTFLLTVGLLVPAALLTWGLAPIRWSGWLAARLASATPPTPTEQAPLCWVAVASLNFGSFLVDGLRTWEVGDPLVRVYGPAIAYSLVTLHIGAALALVPMGVCVAWGRTRALPWVLLGCWGVVTGVLILSRAGWRPF